MIIVALFPLLTRRLPRSARAATDLRVSYLDGHGVLRRLLHAATDQGFTIDELSAEPLARRALIGAAVPDDEPLVEVRLRVRGRTPVSELAAALSEIDDVAAVLVDDDQQAA